MFLTKPLYRLLQTEEFREEMNGKILDSLPEQGGILELSSACFSGYSRVEADEVQMEPLREAMRKDLGDRPADFLVSPEAFPLYMVSMRVWQPEQGYWHYATDSFYLYESDRRTLALLKEWEALPQLRTEFFEGTVVGYIPLEKRDAGHELSGAGRRHLLSVGTAGALYGVQSELLGAFRGRKVL